MKACSPVRIPNPRDLCRAHEVGPHSPLNATVALSQAQLLLSVKHASGSASGGSHTADAGGAGLAGIGIQMIPAYSPQVRGRGESLSTLGLRLLAGWEAIPDQ